MFSKTMFFKIYLNKKHTAMMFFLYLHIIFSAENFTDEKNIIYISSTSESEIFLAELLYKSYYTQINNKIQDYIKDLRSNKKNTKPLTLKDKSPKNMILNHNFFLLVSRDLFWLIFDNSESTNFSGIYIKEIYDAIEDITSNRFIEDEDMKEYNLSTDASTIRYLTELQEKVLPNILTLVKDSIAPSKIALIHYIKQFDKTMRIPETNKNLPSNICPFKNIEHVNQINLSIETFFDPVMFIHDICLKLKEELTVLESNNMNIFIDVKLDQIILDYITNTIKDKKNTKLSDLNNHLKSKLDLINGNLKTLNFIKEDHFLYNEMEKLIYEYNETKLKICKTEEITINIHLNYKEQKYNDRYQTPNITPRNNKYFEKLKRERLVSLMLTSISYLNEICKDNLIDFLHIFGTLQKTFPTYIKKILEKFRTENTTFIFKHYDYNDFSKIEGSFSNIQFEKLISNKKYLNIPKNDDSNEGGKLKKDNEK